MHSRRQMLVTSGCAVIGAVLPSPIVFAKPGPDIFHTEFARIETGTGGRLGVALVDTESDQSVTFRANERFPMCSTAKVLACGALLNRVDAGKESLDRRVLFESADLTTYSPKTKEHVGSEGMTLAALCEAALTLSDNTAMNLILASIGGPAAVTSFARSLGDPLTRLDRTETSLNEAVPGDSRDTTTPSAMAGDLRKLVLGAALSSRSREQLCAWLVANTTGVTKLRAGVPKTWRVGDKTGSGDYGTSNDVAVMWRPDRAPIVAVVYLTAAASVSEEARAAASAAVGRVAVAAFGD